MSRASKTALLVLPLIGLALSAYLWSAKAGGMELICTEFSDCAGVNASAYSEIGGIPIAAAGTVMYVLLTGAGLAVWRKPDLMGPSLRQATFGLALAGALFSLYLTGIEAFVLHAYCVWCLISWVIISITAFLWGRVNTDRPMRDVE